MLEIARTFWNGRIIVLNIEVIWRDNGVAGRAIKKLTDPYSDRICITFVSDIYRGAWIDGNNVLSTADNPLRNM